MTGKEILNIGFIMLTLILVLGWVAIIVINQVNAEFNFCKNKTGIQEFFRDTSKTYLNCTEINLINSTR